MICSCGKKLEFMEYCFFRGIPTLIKVGCPSCNIKFYINAEDFSYKDFPHMVFDDWFRLTKYGSAATMVS